MCVQYRGGAQYRGGVQYRGGYHEYRGGYLEYRGGVQYHGGIMINVGDILSTVGVFSTVGGIMSTMGDVQYRGGFCYLVQISPLILEAGLPISHTCQLSQICHDSHAKQHNVTLSCMISKCHSF